MAGALGAAQDNRAPGNFYLKDGDRVVFYGDSITDQRLYTTFVETYVVTRFPRLKVSFVHSGWGGDRVTGGGGGPIDVRLRRDVIAYQPSVMTIMLGMNDASYRAYDAQIFNTYAEGYRHILSVVKSALPGIRVTLIQPSPFDDVTRPPQIDGAYNAVLVRYPWSPRLKRQRPPTPTWPRRSCPTASTRVRADTCSWPRRCSRPGTRPPR